MDWSTFTNEPSFLDYMALRVHERSDVGNLARDLIAMDEGWDKEFRPNRPIRPRFVVIDELLDFVTGLERETAAQAWTDYRAYLRRRRQMVESEAA